MIYKGQTDFTAQLQQAGRTRIKNQKIFYRTEEELKELTRIFLRTVDLKSPPTFQVFHFSLMRSEDLNRFVKNAGFFFNYEILRLNKLKKHIFAYTKSCSQQLDAIDRKINFLSASIKEAERKKSSISTKVFNRNVFKNIRRDNLLDFKDFKTGILFNSHQSLSEIAKAGMCLPVLKKEQALFENVFLLKESSIHGSSATLLVESDLSSLKKKGETFKYVFYKKINTERAIQIPIEVAEDLYPYNLQPTLVLGFDFNFKQEINFIKIRVASGLPVSISKIEYLNEDNEKQSSLFTLFEDELDKNIIFKPVKTNKIYITFTQKKFYSLESVRQDSQVSQYLNSFIEKSYLIYSSENDIKKEIGHIHDISLDTIQFYNIDFDEYGYYVENKEFIANEPITFSLETTLSNVMEDNPASENYIDIKVFGSEDVDAATSEISEVGAISYQNYIFRKTLPLPDSYPLQKEYLSSLNNVFKTKFFPDLLKDFKVFSFIGSQETELVVNTDFEISLNQGSSWNGSLSIDDWMLLEAEKIAGSFQIRIKKKRFEATYRVEYTVLAKQWLSRDKHFSLKDGRIQISRAFQKSVMALRPIFIMRSTKEILNESPILRSYMLLIEEKEEEKGHSILLEDQEIVESQGTANVL